MVIASQHSETQGIRPWKGMEEWFLLNRIELERPDITGRDIKSPSLIKTNPADAVAAIPNQAPVPAGKTAQFIVREFLVKLPFLHMLIQKLF